MNADDYLKQYLPDFDTAAKRIELQDFTHEELVERLLMAYKNTRVAAMTADLYASRLRRIATITQEELALPSVDRPPANFPEE